MTQEERRRWLIRYLQREMPEYAHYGIPDDEAGQWHLLRALFNVRPPAPVTQKFQRIEGELLKTMTAAKGIVNGMGLSASSLDPPSGALAGRHHAAARRRHRQCGQQPDARLLPAEP